MSELIERRCDYKVVVGRKDQACGKSVPDNVPVEFALAPDSYSADLCDEHLQTLADALAPFVSIARRTRAIASVNGQGRKVLRGKGGRTFTTRDVREWLRVQGQDVPDTGRIPNADIEKFMHQVK